MKITIIGAGNMGGAIARGLAKGSLVNVEDITVSDPNEKCLDALAHECPGMKVMSDNREAVKDTDMVLLAVKPWLVQPVIDDMNEYLVSEVDELNIRSNELSQKGQSLPMDDLVKKRNYME